MFMMLLVFVQSKMDDRCYKYIILPKGVEELKKKYHAHL